MQFAQMKTTLPLTDANRQRVQSHHEWQLLYQFLLCFRIHQTHLFYNNEMHVYDYLYIILSVFVIVSLNLLGMRLFSFVLIYVMYAPVSHGTKRAEMTF